MTTTTHKAPTDKQLDFIRTLFGRLDSDNAAEDFLVIEERVEEGTFDRRDATALIGHLIAEDRKRVLSESKTRHGATVPEVPAGRYALTVDSETAFYKIDRPTQGRWEGWTFVNLTHANGNRIRAVKGSERGSVLARIATDPTAASREYGKQTGTCGVCSRKLTNAESIAAGIGPVCASRIG